MFQVLAHPIRSFPSANVTALWSDPLQQAIMWHWDSNSVTLKGLMIGVMALSHRKDPQRCFQGNVQWTAEWPPLPQGFQRKGEKRRYCTSEKRLRLQRLNVTGCSTLGKLWEENTSELTFTCFHSDSKLDLVLHFWLQLEVVFFSKLN